MQRSAILILNHFMHRSLLDLYDEIVDSCGLEYDVYLASDRTQKSFTPTQLFRRYREFQFVREDLEALQFPAKVSLSQSGAGRRNMTLGNADLPVILFSKLHPQYENLWIIEYDVRFTGSWLSFFQYFETSRADLIGTTLEFHAARPKWSHWGSLRLPEPIDRKNWVCGFFPVYRISRQALNHLEQTYRAGSGGHMEALMPTTLLHGGFELQDIGGSGPFVRSQDVGRFYSNTPSNNQLSPGTFVYRPETRTAGSQPNTLWHPVKEPQRLIDRVFERGLTLLSRLWPVARAHPR